MVYFGLHFCGRDRIELWQTYFKHPILDQPRFSVRGKTTGAFHGSNGSFQWTTPVIALSVLFLNHKISFLQEGKNTAPVLLGNRNSMASSLAYTIDKAPNWLAEMFGTNSKGDLLIRTLTRRSASGYRNGSPIAVSLSPNYFTADNIAVIVNNKAVESEGEIRCILRKLYDQFPKDRSAKKLNSCWGIFDQESDSMNQAELFG
jgi:hypothetical protein